MKDQLQKFDDLYTGDTIRTFSGKYINVFDPNPDDILIEDIAHGLSFQPRFAGHTQVFISVAQHSINVANHFDSPLLKMAALLHDATEAYICDIPKPIKKKIPQYKEIEGNLMSVIARKFCFPFPLANEIKRADSTELEWEFKQAMMSNRFHSWTPKKAKEEFLHAFHKLSAFL